MHFPEQQTLFPRRRQRGEETAILEKSSARLVNWFGWYGERLLRKNFHSVRISGDAPSATLAGPLILYLNHASWWDPMVALFIHRRFFPERRAYAPIDAKVFRRYPFFKKLGFFGVEQGTSRGGMQFLRRSEEILQSPGNVLWLTPQGRFADPRERPLRFQPGLGYLAARAAHAQLVPMAVEYVFWEERFPEVLVRFGKPVPAFLFLNPSQALRSLEGQLAEEQDVLANLAKARRTTDFQTLLTGSVGVGGIYDSWRRLVASCRGERFVQGHGNL